jgi:uncharacterized protein YxeA
MKSTIYILLSIILLTSCVGVKNTVNRLRVDEGESFIKYGVEGYPDGVEVFKGSECLKTDAEIRRFNRQWEKQERRLEKEKNRELKKIKRKIKRVTRQTTRQFKKSE